MMSEVFRELNTAAVPLDRKNTLPVGTAGLGDRKISSVSASTATTSGYLSSAASFSSDRKASVGIPHALQDKRVTSASSPDRKFSVVSTTRVPNPESRAEEKARTSVSSQNSQGTTKSAFADIARKESFNSFGPESINGLGHNPQVPKKFINTWRQACDKTRERTKDLIRRWRTLPEGSPAFTTPDEEGDSSCWSHSLEWQNVESVASLGEPMTTGKSESEWWRCRTYPGCPPPPLIPLSPEQRSKLAQLFNTLLDTDSDSLVSTDDFHSLSERLSEFAGWKENGPQACMLREVVDGLLEAFLLSLHTPDLDADSPSCTEFKNSMSLGLFLGLDDWLTEWSNLLRGAKAIQDLPLWLQYFPKILFAAINKSGSGHISKDELRHFYTAFLGFDSRKVDEALALAYKAMTASGEHKLTCSTYRLIFANFLLGRHPNGPGQFIFGPFGEAGKPTEDVVFPVDYSAMNSLPEDLEEYSPGRKSNRRSVVV